MLAYDCSSRLTFNEDSKQASEGSRSLYMVDIEKHRSISNVILPTKNYPLIVNTLRARSIVII